MELRRYWQLIDVGEELSSRISPMITHDQIDVLTLMLTLAALSGLSELKKGRKTRNGSE